MYQTQYKYIHAFELLKHIICSDSIGTYTLERYVWNYNFFFLRTKVIHSKI